jgi:hypothetical protein
MRSDKFIFIGANRRRDVSGGVVLPCRSAPHAR